MSACLENILEGRSEPNGSAYRALCTGGTSHEGQKSYCNTHRAELTSPELGWDDMGYCGSRRSPNVRRL